MVLYSLFIISLFDKNFHHILLATKLYIVNEWEKMYMISLFIANFYIVIKCGRNCILMPMHNLKILYIVTVIVFTGRNLKPWLELLLSIIISNIGILHLYNKLIHLTWCRFGFLQILEELKDYLLEL
jgi:hypothetical protein